MIKEENIPIRFEAIVEQTQFRSKNRRKLFSLFVRGCRQRGIDSTMIASVRVYCRGLNLCKPRKVKSWDDYELLKKEIRGKLHPKSNERRFIWALGISFRQLATEGEIEPRIRHREKGTCQSCGRYKVIENVRNMLCAQCRGKASIQMRFNKLCKRFTFSDEASMEIFDALLIYEKRCAADIYAWMRVWALGGFLSEKGINIPKLRNWGDVLYLRNAIKGDTKPGRAQKALWALHKACNVLIEKEVLDVRPPKTLGSLQQQLEAISTYFYIEDTYRCNLLRILSDFFERTRVTITAVQTVQGFAYYLARNNVPIIKSWSDIDILMQEAPGPEEPWHSRIQTALRRLGDALEEKGEIQPRIPRDHISQMVGELKQFDRRIYDINIDFLTNIFYTGHRPLTLRKYIRDLNRFWQWAFEHNICDPAYISHEVYRKYISTIRRKGHGPVYIEATNSKMRLYFDWLRRQHHILSNPVPKKDKSRQIPVRVCSKQAFESLVAALGNGTLQPREGLIIYLIVFHALRNYEIVESIALGFRIQGPHKTFDIELPPPIISAGSYKNHRYDRIIRLPVGRYPWLNILVQSIVEDRARIIKQKKNKYLFVSESWRQGTRPMESHCVTDYVGRASERICGCRIAPSLLRQSAAAYFADISDHTLCCAMGYSAKSAVRFAYATREVVDLVEQ